MRVPITLSIALFAAPALFGASSVKEFHQTVAVAAGARVTIESHNGSVAVTTWAQPNVSIDARIEPSEWGDADDVQATKIRVSGGGGDLSIVSDFDAVPTHTSFFGFGETRTTPLVHYTVRMPATASLKVRVHNAKVSVAGVAGGIDVETHNGDIDATALAGGTRVETHNGDVQLAFTRFAPTRITTHNGTASVAVPPDSRISIVADAHARNPVRTDFPVAVRTSGEDFEGTMNGGGTELRMSTHNGSLHLHR